MPIRPGGTTNVVILALATSGALMLMTAYLRWIDHPYVLMEALFR
jgi:hypothetical protein